MRARSATSTFPIAGFAPGTTSENLDRWRYAVRIGIRGDITENWFYGAALGHQYQPPVRLGDLREQQRYSGSSAAPYGKDGDGINVGQAYMGWRATPWLTLQAGKMPNPVYTTPMVWDPDINPEGIAERFNFPVNDKLNLFGNFGQYVYQTYNPQSDSVAHDGYQFAWQGGVNYKFAAATSAKVALGFYNYSGFGSQPDLWLPSERRAPTASAAPSPRVRRILHRWPNAFNDGVNNLSYVEIPWEFNFPVGSGGILGRAFGDVAYNTQADQRAAKGSYASLGSQGLAWQVGLSVGTAIGLTMNQGNPKKHALGGARLLAADRSERLGSEPHRLRLLRRPHQHAGAVHGIRLQPSRRDHHHLPLRGSSSHQPGRPDPGKQRRPPERCADQQLQLLQFDLTWKF